MSDGLQQFGTALLPEADFTMASSDGVRLVHCNTTDCYPIISGVR